MAPLFNGAKAEVNPEAYVDVSPSEAWPWQTDQDMCTWNVQIPSVRAVTVPFALLDSQAENEQQVAASLVDASAGGVEIWPFSDKHLAFSDKRDPEGNLIIDANPVNFDERWAYFLSIHPRYFDNGLPGYGGTNIMTAVSASDDHFMREFGGKTRSERPVRARMVHTDGLLKDADKFRAYLAMAAPVRSPEVSTVISLGNHKEWEEAWIIAIYGEEGGEGHRAYEQYREIAQDHPWIHPVYFASVVNPDEAAEDVAYLTVPVAA
jgi:hypothetical protein